MDDVMNGLRDHSLQADPSEIAHLLTFLITVYFGSGLSLSFFPTSKEALSLIF